MNQNPSKNFDRYKQASSKIYLEKERNWIARMILKKNKIGGITLPDYKTYYM